MGVDRAPALQHQCAAVRGLEEKENRAKTRSMDFVRYLLFWHCQLVLISSQRLDSPDGILLIGSSSSASRSVEFWSPSNPEEGSCQLNDYPRRMNNGPTANIVSGQLVACSEDSCEIFNGGVDSKTTEWISVDGSPSQPGPFDVRHGDHHCTIQLSSNVLVITGGYRTEDLVTRYKMTGNGDETPLTSMNRDRYSHACGVYRDAGGQQVLLVTGGTGYDRLSSTEVAVYSSGSQLKWREVEGGQLPEPRFGLRATSIGAVLYVSGGKDYNSLTSILSWDPATESWQPAGDLAAGRYYHAAVAVPASTIALYCKNN